MTIVNKIIVTIIVQEAEAWRTLMGLYLYLLLYMITMVCLQVHHNTVTRAAQHIQCHELITPESSVIHMEDFGLAKPFIDADTGRHIPYSENRSICGTLRYISLNVHKVSLFNQISYLYNADQILKSAAYLMTF